MNVLFWVDLVSKLLMIGSTVLTTKGVVDADTAQVVVGGVTAAATAVATAITKAKTNSHAGTNH